jgi:hypothetical protein
VNNTQSELFSFKVRVFGYKAYGKVASEITRLAKMYRFSCKYISHLFILVDLSRVLIWLIYVFLIDRETKNARNQFLSPFVTQYFARKNYSRAVLNVGNEESLIL